MSREYTLAGTDVRVISVGGLETCIEVPDWKLCLDIGRCPPSAVRLPSVFFTHAHCDHMGGIAHHMALRDLWNLKAPHYIVPKENHEAFLDLVDAWRRLDKAELPCTVTPISPGDRIEMGVNRYVEAFRAVHRVPTLGYALVSQKRRLLPRLKKKSGQEIARLRKQGEQVERVEETVELAFCGDTCIDVIHNEPMVRKARALILEVTFMDDRVSVEKARRTGHVHLDEIIENAEYFENEVLLFTHFSSRYRGKDIQRILAERLPDCLKDRVIPCLPDGTWVD